jgi:hypothetical protein
MHKHLCPDWAQINHQNGSVGLLGTFGAFKSMVGLPSIHFLFSAKRTYLASFTGLNHSVGGGNRL